MIYDLDSLFFKKTLEQCAAVFIVRTPFDARRFKRRENEGRSLRVFRQNFLSFSQKSLRKMLTKKKRNVLFELFPLTKEALFEIYFVRLIGTPNQKYYSKTDFAQWA